MEKSERVESAKSYLPLLDISRENESLTDDCLERISDVISSGQFVLGPAVTDLEQARRNTSDLSQNGYGRGAHTL